jgi:hypothetical protein
MKTVEEILNIKTNEADITLSGWEFDNIIQAMEAYANQSKREVIDGMEIIVDKSFDLIFYKPEHALKHIKKYLLAYKLSIR